MKHEDHCDLTKRRFGQDFKHIHLDLDQDFTLVGSPHRAHRHHLDYVIDKFIKGIWNVDECRAAIHHIIDDCGVLMVKSDWCEVEVVEMDEKPKGSKAIDEIKRG